MSVEHPREVYNRVLELFVVIAIDDVALCQAMLFHNVPRDLVNGVCEATFNGSVTVINERQFGIHMNEGGR